jgi:hypothetical protein
VRFADPLSAYFYGRLLVVSCQASSKLVSLPVLAPNRFACFPEPDIFAVVRCHHRQSSSASRFTARAFGFLTFSQRGVRTEPRAPPARPDDRARNFKTPRPWGGPTPSLANANRYIVTPSTSNRRRNTSKCKHLASVTAAAAPGPPGAYIGQVYSERMI